MTAPRPRMLVVSSATFSFRCSPVVVRNFPRRFASSRLALKDRRLLLVHHQRRSKLLQRALSSRPRVELHPQRHLPAQVVVCPLLRLVVRHSVVRLQHQRHGQHARRHARPSVVQHVQPGKLLVLEQLPTLARQPPGEAFRPRTLPCTPCPPRTTLAAPTVSPASRVPRSADRFLHPTRPTLRSGSPLSGRL